MSGKKVSDVRLNEQRRRENERRRQQELQRRRREEAERLRREAEQRRKEEERRRKIAEAQSSLRSQILSVQKMLTSVSSATDKMKGYINSGKNVKNRDSYDNAINLCQQARQFLSSANTSSEDLSKLNRDKQTAGKLIRGMQNTADTVMGELNDNKQSYISLLTSQIESVLGTSGSNNSLSGSDTDQNIAELEAQVYWLKKLEIEMENVPLELASPEIAQKFRQKRAKLADARDSGTIKRFVTDEIPRVKRKISEYQQQLQALTSEFNEVYINYALLCEETGTAKESFDLSSSGISSMKKACVLMNAKVMRKRENEEVFRIVQETMQELGYPLLAEKLVTESESSSEGIRKLLLRYTEDTAVRVTVTPDGQVAMEMGLMDNEDRNPNDDDIGYLCDQMKNFCTDYQQIESKLAEKGIVFERKNYLPPEPAYAEIINVKEFDLEVAYDNSFPAEGNSETSNDQDVALANARLSSQQYQKFPGGV